jgi:ABC-type multidrug transport system permease subunit
MPGFQTEPSRAGFQFFIILITELFSVTLGQALASITPSPFISAQFDPFIIINFALFCGVTIPKPQIPGFWRAWMYQLDPFTRLISSMVTTALHGVEVVCKQSELNRFTSPSNSTCGEYMEPFFANGGRGYLVNDDTRDCEYCAYKVGDEFYSTFDLSFNNRWRDLGIFACFIASNLIIIILAVSNPV